MPIARSPLHCPPAILGWRDGVPCSTRFGDVYHSRAGGVAQAREVFLAGCGLPARWRGVHEFSLCELGFGLGINFLVSWAAWLDDPARAPRFHYVSCEQYPLSPEALRAAWQRILRADQPAEARLLTLGERLLACYPPRWRGLHRIEFSTVVPNAQQTPFTSPEKESDSPLKTAREKEKEKAIGAPAPDGGTATLVLSLVWGDASEVLRGLSGPFDAFYLDGFSPACNPAMWQAALYTQCARIAAPAAMIASYSVAGSLRRSLQQAGFAVQKEAGFSGKRERLTGTLRAPRRPRPVYPRREALVIGGGLAGSAVCERLAARGWSIHLLEEAATLAQGASGNRSGFVHPLIAQDDGLSAQLSRAALLYARVRWAAASAAGTDDRLGWNPCGVLLLPRDAEEAARLHAACTHYPADYARWLDAAAATRCAGVPLAQQTGREGGAYFALGGYLSPSAWVATQWAMAQRHAACWGASAELHCGTQVATIRHEKGLWCAFDAQGQRLAHAPVLVLCNGAQAQRWRPELAMQPHLRAVTHAPPDALPAALHPLRTVLCRGVPGRVEYADAASWPPPPGSPSTSIEEVPTGGSVYLTPAWQGAMLFGTVSVETIRLPIGVPAGAPTGEILAELARLAAHNRERLQYLSSAAWTTTAPEAHLAIPLSAVVPSKTGTRCCVRADTHDHLPWAGAVVDTVRYQPKHRGSPWLIPREPGLFVLAGLGARGLLWHGLLAEALACQITGEPSPLTRREQAALDPARGMA